jgi:hypothetical protein
MSTTTKSPRKVLVTALRVAQRKLAAYRHRFSPQKFTQPQLFACLVFKTFMGKDYRGVTAYLQDSPDLCRVIGLKQVPHFTTLQKASRNLLRLEIAQRLLEGTVRLIRKRKPIAMVAIDSTGLESGHTSKYFVCRKHARKPGEYDRTHYRRFPKLSVSSDCSTHLILSVLTTRGPTPDVNMFKDIVIPATSKYHIAELLADAGYDSEANHRFAREQRNVRTIIPAKRGRSVAVPLKGKYRRKMQLRLPKKKYGQRWQVETVFSMMKRNFGESIYARKYWSQCREMMLMVLTHNIAVVLLVKELFYRAGQVHLFSMSLPRDLASLVTCN